MIFGMVRVPAPRHTMTREKTDELTVPSFMVVLINLPGEVTTLNTLFPGDIGGVDDALITCIFLNSNVSSSITSLVYSPSGLLYFGFLASSP